jgi:hypothetical protein
MISEQPSTRRVPPARFSIAVFSPIAVASNEEARETVLSASSRSVDSPFLAATLDAARLE